MARRGHSVPIDAILPAETIALWRTSCKTHGNASPSEPANLNDLWPLFLASSAMSQPEIQETRAVFVTRRKRSFGHSDLSEAMSMEKRYFTSALTSRS